MKLDAHFSPAKEAAQSGTRLPDEFALIQVKTTGPEYRFHLAPILRYD